VNSEDERIGAALRDIADQATPPRLDAGAVWRAGRRRRWTALTASAGSVAAAAALVPVILLGVLSGPAPGKLKQPWPPAARPHPAIEFRQLARVAHKPCPPGSPGLPGTSRHVCYYFTSTGMTARIESARVTRVSSEQNLFQLNVSLMPAYRHRFETLTAGIAHQRGLRNQLATIAHGVVINTPAVEGALRGGLFEVWATPGTRASTTHLLHLIEGH
jgi:hypothetical protein